MMDAILVTAIIIFLVILRLSQRPDHIIALFPRRPQHVVEDVFPPRQDVFPAGQDMFSLGQDPHLNSKQWNNQRRDKFCDNMNSRVDDVLQGCDFIKCSHTKKAIGFPNTEHIFFDAAIRVSRKKEALSQGPALKERLSLVFTNINKLSMRKSIWANTIKEVVATYICYVTSLKENVADISTATNICTFNATCSITIGHILDYNDKAFQKLIDYLNSTALDYKNISLMKYISCLKYISGDLFMAKIITLNVQKALRLLKKFISIKRRDGADLNDVKHFIEAYLIERNNKVEFEMSNYMEDECSRKNIQELFGAETETKCVIMPWCEIQIASSSYMKDMVYREIKKHLVPDKPFNKQDTTKTPFPDPVILETQTFASIAPLSLLKPLNMQDKSKHPCPDSVILETQPFTGIAPLSLLKTCPGNLTPREHAIPKESRAIPNLNSVCFDKTLRVNDPVTLTAQEFIHANSKLQVCMQLSPYCKGHNVGLGEARDKKEIFMFLSNVFHRF